MVDALFRGILLLQVFVQGKGPEHAKILNWWDEVVFIQKPLNCKINSCYFKANHQITSSFMKSQKTRKILESRYCNILDSKYLIHSFKGKTRNGMFEGPGKLRIFQEV